MNSFRRYFLSRRSSKLGPPHWLVRIICRCHARWDYLLRTSNRWRKGWRRIDAEVHWEGRLVGHICDVMVEQPFYTGLWTSAGDPGFEREYRAIQTCEATNGFGVIPVVLLFPEVGSSVPAAAMVHSGEPDPYLRFRGEGYETRNGDGGHDRKAK